MADKARVLVVANRTAESPELLDALRSRVVHGPCEFTLLVPSTAHGLAWAADPGEAGHRRPSGTAWPSSSSCATGALDVVDAKVGDGDPLAAISDECNFTDYDELIVSTLPLRISKWLHLDLPRKAEAATGLPTTHVVGSEA